MTKMIPAYSYAELVARVISTAYSMPTPGWEHGAAKAARDAVDVLDERLAKHGITVGDEL